MYYLQSRYYNPEWGRFVNADGIVGQSGELLSHNMFAYCMNNPVNMDYPSGYLPKWLKVTIGAVAVIAAVTITVATGGAAAPLLIGVAASTLTSAAVGYATGGTQGMIDGAIDGFMWGGIGALGSSVVSAIKALSVAKKGIVIGEKMKDRVIPASKQLGARYYKGLKGYSKIERVLGEKTASNLGMAHNKAWIKRQMKLGAEIFDIGSAGSNSPNYAMEQAVTSGYTNIFRFY